MAARYWVGGTASWDGTAGTKWALTSGGAGGQAIPTSADDVFFDAASGAVTCTIATGNTGAKSITCTGFTGTIAGSAAISVAGSVTLVAGQGFTYTGTLTMTATGTLTTGGKTLNNLTMDAPGGTVSLGSAITVSTIITLTAGTFTTNNYSVSGERFASFNSNVRTINLGSSNFTLSAIPAIGIAWNTGLSTNLTLNAGTSTITITAANGRISLGGGTFNNVTFSSNASTPDGVQLLNANGTIAGTLTLTAPASAGVTPVMFDGSPTIGTLVASGASVVQRLFFYTPNIGNAASLTITTWSTISDIDFRDITMNSSRSGTRLGNCGGNTNITFPAAKTVYWNLAGTQNWSATGWATSSGGTPAVNNFPLAQDTVVFNNTGAAGTVTIDSKWNIGAFSAPSRTSAMTLDIVSQPNIHISFTMGSGITPSGTGTLVFSGRGGTQVVTTSGKTMTCQLSVQNVGGTVLLADAYTSNVSVAQAIAVFNGTFNTGNFNITLTGAGSGITFPSIFTRTLTFGGSSIIIAGLNGFTAGSTGATITANTATMSLTSASTKSFSGGGLNYNGLTINQGGAGALDIGDSNTFGNITNTYAATGATSIRFSAGTTNTFTNWNASGQAGRLLTIGSPTAASHTLSKSTGTVSADYLSISRSTATGGATWYAGANSTNGGNNTGWIFSAAPASATGNFLAFFM